MKKLIASLVLVLGLGGMQGCATGNQIHYSPEGPAVFGGLRMVGAIFGAPHLSGGDIAMAILDAPLSLCFDVVLLPFSAINEVYHGGINVDPPPPPPSSAELRKYGAEERVFREMQREEEEGKKQSTIQ